MITMTGEMGERDIKPGGEFYEWANLLKSAARRLTNKTNGKVNLLRIRPFDKYCGPYAQMDQGVLWSGENEGEYFFDGKEVIKGSIKEIADRLNQILP